MANRQQRRAAQKHANSAPAASEPGEALARLFAVALDHQRSHRFAEAEQLYRDILARDRGQAGAWINLAILYCDHGAFDRAASCYAEAIERKPDDLDLHNSLCTMLIVQGRFDAAAAHYEQLVAYRPDFARGFSNLAVCYLGMAQPQRALAAVRRALALAETPDSKALFTRCLLALPAPPDDDDASRLVLRALTEPWCRPGQLAAHATALIKRNAAIAACIDRAAQAWPRRVPAAELFGPSGLDVLASEPLLAALLQSAHNGDLALELCLTNVRLALLEAAESRPDTTQSAHLAFHAALARQCFINEYVFDITDDECTRVARLRTRIAADIEHDAIIAPLDVLALASYEKLSSLPHCEALLAQLWPAPVDAVLTQQLREPAMEQRLRATIPALTPVDDAVSRAVQSQYEENPYPRWQKAVPSGSATDIVARLRTQFPASRFRPFPHDGAVEILVAGCGTGQQLVDVAQRIAGSRVLAVDLSMASLAYAKRKTGELGITNIDYAQADILELGRLNRRFDVVDSGGVLHHLGDPEQGWRVLTSLVKPGGVMRIALYSDLARRHIVAARDYIAANGYPATPDGIRRFRQDARALPDGELVKLVSHSPDFFSISDCRDLVFHVHEHRFTLPRIHDFLAANGLTFLGFEIDQAAFRRYDARFPDNPARDDLARWDAFEHAHPGTFGGMYQFWAQKDPAS